MRKKIRIQKGDFADRYLLCPPDLYSESAGGDALIKPLLDLDLLLACFEIQRNRFEVGSRKMIGGTDGVCIEKCTDVVTDI